MRAGAGAGRVPRDCASRVSPPQDQSLGNWRIKRQILEGEEIAYKFTPKYVLRAGQTVTVGGCRQGLGCWGAGVLRGARLWSRRLLSRRLSALPH